MGPPGGSAWERPGQVLEPSSCLSPSPGASAVSPGRTSLFLSPSLGCSQWITVEVRGRGAGEEGAACGCWWGGLTRLHPQSPGRTPRRSTCKTQTTHPSPSCSPGSSRACSWSSGSACCVSPSPQRGRSGWVGGGEASLCSPTSWLKPGCAPRPPGRIWAIQTQLLDKFVCLVRAQGLSDDNIIFPDLTGGLLSQLGSARGLGALWGPAGARPTLGAQV